MDYETLISEVERRPALWDSKDIEHCNRDLVYKKWTEVADILGFEGNVLDENFQLLCHIFYFKKTF